MKEKIIGFPHPPQKNGGPGSFQSRLEGALKKQGWEVVYPQDGITPSVILVVGGTRKIKWLKACKKQGSRIVHRLDGRNWLHRIQKLPLKYKILCEIRNFLTAKIRKKYADHVIYQSQFVKDWWEKKCGLTKSTSSIIHNAVDLEVFKPNVPCEGENIICVEGNIDYSPYALETLDYIAKQLKGKGIEDLLIYGGFQDQKIKEQFPSLNFKGNIPREEISEVYRNGIFLSLDINAACPNTVIEALASGIPVVGFDTGALKELVKGGAGEIVEYDSDPWRLEKPNFDNLKKGILKILTNFDEYSVNARKEAESQYSLDDLTEKYLKILNIET